MEVPYYKQGCTAALQSWHIRVTWIRKIPQTPKTTPLPQMKFSQFTCEGGKLNSGIPCGRISLADMASDDQEASHLVCELRSATFF